MATGSVRPFIKAPDTGGVLDWSSDSAWLSYSTGDTQSQHVYLHNIVNGRLVDAGPGNLVALRAREPQVIAAMVGGRGNQSAFGATVYTFDVTQQRGTQLFSVEPRITRLMWSPDRDEFLYLQDTTGCRYRSTIWVGTLSGSTRRIGAFDSAEQAWWSKDGARVYALLRGTGTDANVIDTASGQRIATIPNDVPGYACP